jgi:hypothetical protein
MIVDSTADSQIEQSPVRSSAGSSRAVGDGGSVVSRARVVGFSLNGCLARFLSSTVLGRYHRLLMPLVKFTHIDMTEQSPDRFEHRGRIEREHAVDYLLLGAGYLGAVIWGFVLAFS